MELIILRDHVVQQNVFKLALRKSLLNQLAVDIIPAFFDVGFSNTEHFGQVHSVLALLLDDLSEHFQVLQMSIDRWSRPSKFLYLAKENTKQMFGSVGCFLLGKGLVVEVSQEGASFLLGWRR